MRAVVFVLLAGCATLAPAYERPAAPIPPQLPGASGDAKPLAWQGVVREPKLRSLIETALVNNRDVRASVLAIEAARAQYRIARAQALPNIDAGVGVQAARTVVDTANHTVTSELYSAQVGLAGWEIDLFGRVRSLSAAARHQVLSAAENVRAARLSLIGELASAYVAYAADRSRLVIAQDTEKLAKQTMDLTEQLVGGGTSNRGDVYQAQTVYEQARGDVAALTAAIAQDRNAIELLAGAPVSDEVLPAGLPEQLDWFADVPIGLASAVLLDRPDVRAAEEDLIAANANIGAARASLFPSLTLTASGGIASLALGALFTGPAAVWTLAPALALPLFRPGARANVALARAQKEQLIAVYEGTIQRAFRETADALAVRGTIAEQLSAGVALVEASQKSVDLAQARYKGGIDPFIATLVAQRQLYGAKQALVATQAQALVNRVTLYRVLGGASEK